MEFIFTEKNRELYEIEKEWIAGNCFGAYMLTEKSGCGKTTLLRQLDADWKEQKNLVHRMKEIYRCLIM